MPNRIGRMVVFMSIVKQMRDSAGLCVWYIRLSERLTPLQIPTLICLAVGLDYSLHATKERIQVSCQIVRTAIMWCERPT